MYLKRLEILGFKTFAERTELHFAPGLTAVIGPNGSGKSNIADAILWVLGENNVRELRGSTAQDVIFAGNDRRKPLGMAEVALTIDNSTRILPLDFGEITVTRRVYRSGESECFINRVPCRLRDIYELFLDTGLGRDAYSMIGQGEIDSILSVRAEDRRAIFEEAAGIKKYRHRKREAERKLEMTHQNLLRLNDIMVEIESQLGPLARQAAAAKRYQEVARQLETLGAAFYGLRLRRLAQEAGSLQQLRDQLRDERTRLEAEGEGARAAEQGAAQALVALDRQLEALRGRESAAQERLKTLTVERARCDERARHLQGRLEATRLELDELESRGRRRAEEQDASGRGAEEAAARHAAAAAELDAARRAAGAQQQARDRAQAEVAELRRRAMERVRREAEQGSRLNAVRQRCASLAEQEARLAVELAEAEKGVSEAQAAAAGSAATLATLLARRESLAPEQERLAQAIQAADDTAAALGRELEAARRELAAAGGRRQALAELAERGDGASAGARALLAAARQGELPGSFELLAETLRVPPGLERAVEAALGPYTDAVIAESLDSARAALGWLRAHGETALLFAPPAGGWAAAAGSLAEQVEAAGAPAAVARALLGEVLLVEELPDRPTAGAPPARLWVTRSGEWISAAGGVCGGAEAADRALAAAQGRRREIERLEAAIRELQVRLQRLEGERTHATARRQELAAAAQAAGEEAARVRAETETARRGVERERQDTARAEQRQLRLAAESERLARERLTAQAQLEGFERAAAAAGGAAGGEQEVEAAAARAQAAETAWRAQEAVVADLRVLGAQCERAAESAAQEARRLAGAVAQLDRERSTRLATRTQLERELAALARPADGPDEAAAAAAELDSLRAALAAAAASRQEAATRAAAAARDARAFTERRQELLERSHRAEIEHTAVETERRRLADQWAECAAALAGGVDERQAAAASGGAGGTPLGSEGPPQGEANPAPPAEVANGAGELALEALFDHWDARAAEEALARVPDPEAEVRRLRRQLRSLGAISPDAVAEHARQSERHAFLTAQRQDLETAREQVLGAIQEIDAASKETFQKAFVEIGVAFQEMFQQLFGGGQAELRLTDPDDVLETGIEVLVQPPGKRRQNLLLLSGGERALTAAAMLFALLKIRPSPFVVMDEVDAPLDESNVARFGETLRAFAARTQFIVVTHNRGTMEAVDTLYGVTMQERGVSRVLSCALTDDLVRESEGRPVERERASMARS